MKASAAMLLLVSACGAADRPAPIAAAAPSPSTSLRETFEDAEPGRAPAGWTLSPDSVTAGWTVTVAAEGCAEGKRCLQLTPGGDPQTMGWLSRRLDATPFRGQRVRLRVASRCASRGPAEGAAVALHALGKDDAVMATRRVPKMIRAIAWEQEEVVLAVPADAAAIQIMLAGSGVVTPAFDDVRIDLAEAAAPVEAPRALAGRGLENLTAFARLYGYVRWFHPSDEATRADWNAVALAGVRAVEAARDPAELAGVLDGIFRPLAPSLAVYPTGMAPPPAVTPPPPGTRRVRWAHLGLGSGGKESVYRSWRRGVDPEVGGGSAEAGFSQTITDAAPLRGTTLRLRGWVRTEGSGNARLALAVRAAGGKDLAIDEMDAHPIVSPRWARFEVSVPVAAEAGQIDVVVELRGAGRAWFDDLALDAGGRSVALANAGFEAGGDEPDVWQLYMNGRGYVGGRRAERPHAGKGCAFLENQLENVLDADVAPLDVELGGGVAARVPLSVARDDAGTLPRAAEAAPTSAAPVVADADDRATRLADVIILWNILQHFWPYFDVVKVDWRAALGVALAAAATDADGVAFTETLNRLVALLHDGHGGVGYARSPQSGPLPLRCEWVEDALVIIAVAPGTEGLRRGDRVDKIGGRPVAELAAEHEPRVSAATPGHRRWRLLRELMTGPARAPVTLDVTHPDGSTAAIALRYGGLGARAPEEPRPDKVAELEPGIMYVDLGRARDADITAAMPRLAAARGVVVDLRGYPADSPMLLSHLTAVPMLSSRWEIPLILRPDHTDVVFQESSWSVPPLAPRLAGKVAFLTDGRAISYAETYLGFVEQYRLAAIVGATTAGTNGNVNPTELPGGYNVWWTGMRVRKRDGSRHHGVGIAPTIPAVRTRAGVAAGRDEVLERGVMAVR